MCLDIIFHHFLFFSLSDLGLCCSFGSMWTKTPLECVKSNSVTPEALMGKSWHLAVNEALYSAGHLSRDQGLSLIWAFSLKCRVWVRLMSLGTICCNNIGPDAHLSHCISPWLLSSFELQSSLDITQQIYSYLKD